MAESDTPSLWQFVPAAATVAGGVLSLYGGSQAAKGAEGAGNASYDAAQRAATSYRDLGQRVAASERIKASRTKAAAEFAAEQAEVNAGQQLAASQRDAIEERRQSRLLQSRAITIAAASGAGASDPSVAYLVGRIKGEGSLRAANALYAGEDRARQLRMQAAAKHYEGLTAEEAGELNAGDVLASSEAKAVGEVAKGVAAQEAGKIAAQAATTKGVSGALPALGALAGLYGMYDKYFNKGDDYQDEDFDNGDPDGATDYLDSDGQALQDEIIASNTQADIDAAAAADIDTVSTISDDYEWLELLDLV